VNVLVLQWHQDTFELPEGATLLATSPAYPNQAFRVGDVAYGVQFHVEVDEAMADEWARVAAYISSADEVLGAGGLDRLLADFPGFDGRDAGRRTNAIQSLGRSLGLNPLESGARISARAWRERLGPPVA